MIIARCFIFLIMIAILVGSAMFYAYVKKHKRIGQSSKIFTRITSGQSSKNVQKTTATTVSSLETSGKN